MKPLFIALLTSTLAFFSPAHAQEKCQTLDQIASELKSEAGDALSVKKLVGDDLKAFNDKIATHWHLSPPPGQDGVLVVTKDGSETAVLVQAWSGCVAKVTTVPKAALDSLDKPAGVGI